MAGQRVQTLKVLIFSLFVGFSRGSFKYIPSLAISFPPHFFCYGSGRVSKSNSQVTASQTQESVVNYYI